MKKSTITCDMEGRILTMNDGAVQIFGYSKEEIIGKKRVSLFSPGEIVLQNVAGWLDQAVKKGEYVGKTYFCLLYTSPSPRDATLSRMPSSA